MKANLSRCYLTVIETTIYLCVYLCIVEDIFSIFINHFSPGKLPVLYVGVYGNGL